MTVDVCAPRNVGASKRRPFCHLNGYCFIVMQSYDKMDSACTRENSPRLYDYAFTMYNKCGLATRNVFAIDMASRSLIERAAANHGDCLAVTM